MITDVGKNVSKARKAKGAKEKATPGDKENKAVFSGVEVTKLRKIKADAFIGYRVMNMCPPPKGAYWGKFNDRVVEQKWVNDLASAFEGDLDNCSEDTTMNVVVYKHWLEKVEEGKAEVTMLEGKTLDEVPALGLTNVGQREASDDNLWIMGGNHRRLALSQFLEKTRADLEKDEADLEKISEANKKSTDAQGENEEKRMREEVSRKRKLIEKGHKWVVKVYDRGA